MSGKIIIGAIIFSLLPIWRCPGHTRHDGVNFWNCIKGFYDLNEGNLEFTHLPYEEARRRASEAWKEHIGNRRKLK